MKTKNDDGFNIFDMDGIFSYGVIFCNRNPSVIFVDVNRCKDKEFVLEKKFRTVFDLFVFPVITTVMAK